MLSHILAYCNHIRRPSRNRARNKNVILQNKTKRIRLNWKITTTYDEKNPQGIIVIFRVVAYMKVITNCELGLLDSCSTTWWSGQSLQGSFSAVSKTSKPILQPNIRWKALAEIYTMHSVVQLSNLNFLSEFAWMFANRIRPNRIRPRCVNL